MLEKELSAAAEELQSLRSEIQELDAVEEMSEEQSARYAEIIDVWDEKKEAYDKLEARAAKLEEIRQASLDPKNVTPGFAAPHVHIKRSAFDDMDSVRTADPNSDEMISRAKAAVEEAATRRDDDKAVENALRTIDVVPGASTYAYVHANPHYRSAFLNWLQSGGQPVYTAEEAAAMRASMSLTSANGGYALPTLLDPTLIYTGTGSQNPLRRVARVESGTQNVWYGVSTAGVTTAWTGENTALTDGSPTFAQPSVTAHKLTAYVTASYEIFQDSNLAQQLPGLINRSIDVAEAAAFINGSGSGAPKGILTALTGVTTSAVTVTTRGSFTSASVADVFAIVNALPVRVEDNATWVANKQTFNTIRQMSTGSYGSLFWQDGVGMGEQLLGSPAVKSADVTTSTATGSIFAVLGDFQDFLIYDRVGVSVELIQNVVDGSGVPTGTRGLVAYKRVGSDCLNTGSFKYLLG